MLIIHHSVGILQQAGTFRIITLVPVYVADGALPLTRSGISQSTGNVSTIEKCPVAVESTGWKRKISLF